MMRLSLTGRGMGVSRLPQVGNTCLTRWSSQSNSYPTGQQQLVQRRHYAHKAKPELKFVDQTDHFQKTKVTRLVLRHMAKEKGEIGDMSRKERRRLAQQDEKDTKRLFKKLYRETMVGKISGEEFLQAARDMIESRLDEEDRVARMIRAKEMGFDMSELEEIAKSQAPQKSSPQDDPDYEKKLQELYPGIPLSVLMRPENGPELPEKKDGDGDKQPSRPDAIVDAMSRGPALQFTRLLRDLMPGTESADLQPRRWELKGFRLPLGAHLAYFPLATVPSKLAVDGADQAHVPPGFALSPDGVQEGGFRLWAGGSLEFDPDWSKNPVLGEPNLFREWECCEDISQWRKMGGNGTQMLDISREYKPKGTKVPYIKEQRQLAFVPKWDKEKRGSLKSLGKPTASFSVTATPAHLFQFSALTFNAHYIHLPNSTISLVHGPLLLALMLRGISTVIRSSEDIPGGHLNEMTYRNIAPVRVGEKFRVCVRRPELKLKEGEVPNFKTLEKWEAWVEDEEGRLCVRAMAQVAHGTRPTEWSTALPGLLQEKLT